MNTQIAGFGKFGLELRRVWGTIMGSSTVAAPWKQLLLNAIQTNSHLKHSSFFQLATVGPHARPSNRTVVFRGFEEGSHKILINTDYRSRKIEDIKYCPYGEICWYFTDSWEQFRINGRIEIIDESNHDPIKLQQRENAWFASSLRSRLQYLGLSPGLPCVNEEQGSDVLLDSSSGPVGAFCLLVLDPEQVDYLNLKSNERLTYTCKQSDGRQCWTFERVNP